MKKIQTVLGDNPGIEHLPATFELLFCEGGGIRNRRVCAWLCRRGRN
ncbi:hypothetical protein ACVBEG_27555 [Pseudomonas sp. GG8]